MALLETVLYWPTIASVIVLYITGLYVYLLALHPLAKLTVPKLAAISLWYEFYND